ncbi:MAG: beta-N-acetylhexosaminidase [Flavobacteriaceae bacterium]
MLKYSIKVLALFTIIFTSCEKKQRTINNEIKLSVIPHPNDLIIYDNHFALNNDTKIVASNATQTQVAERFIKQLYSDFGINCNVSSNNTNSENTIALIEDKTIQNEGYILDSYINKVLIKASTSAGYYYGLQTLLQTRIAELDNEIHLNLTHIKDAPKFEWRGVMLDLSRHFFGVESIKTLVDEMAVLKMNRLHLHLTDDSGWRIEIKQYPKLHTIASKGDRSNPDGPHEYLTVKDAQLLAQYAKDRQIVIVPEIDIPGHSAAVERAYPEFGGGHNTLNIANEDAFEMVKTVIKELSELFDTPYVHFGGDEVRKHKWFERTDMQQKMRELGLENQKQLEGWFDREVANFIRNENLTPVAWDEASDFEVNKKTIIQWWRCLKPKVLRHALNKNYQVILSPANFVYLDYPQAQGEGGAHWEGLNNGPNTMESIYTWNYIPKGISEEAKNQIIGIEAALWTEFISTDKRLEYMAYPRLFAIAEKSWTSEQNLNWNDFERRSANHEKYLDTKGINYRKNTISNEERASVQPEAYEGVIK